MKLHGYFRSSAAYRVRIALNLKGLTAEPAYLHLRKGEQAAPAYTALNPQKLVPTLEDEGAVLTQSLAIIEYLEERHPHPALLPADPADRARVRAIALAIACEIHPLNNLRVLNHLRDRLGLDEAARNDWYRHWVSEGFAAVEAMLAGDPRTGRLCHGDTPTLADVVLVPQVYNAERFAVDLAPYPAIRRIAQTARALDAFAAADPDRQPDAE
ncbi:maleylacetoacetate isomerase [Azospirillum halopraeferens]|uniref:maleylacetoacetate isomerase n=1 Tax=Azospirillum halopraeferens TaxID=34010 RepID=UPI000424E26D|nr:maleylacetoacetate isomerase [Azospirillum halopraeferens]